jgi:hypothetical protein
VSWLDAILGRDKPLKSSLEQLFGLSTAGLTLETEAGLKPTNAAAISFRPVSSGQFRELKQDLESLLTTSTKDAPLQWKSFTDPYGYEWIILQADEFENLIATVHMISRELQDARYGELLLASVFQFKQDGNRNVYWVYNYKRGAFYPFVPSKDQTRDNALELRLSALMQRELNVEQDLAKWYALWGVPLDR